MKARCRHGVAWFTCGACDAMNIVYQENGEIEIFARAEDEDPVGVSETLADPESDEYQHLMEFQDELNYVADADFCSPPLSVAEVYSRGNRLHAQYLAMIGAEDMKPAEGGSSIFGDIKPDAYNFWNSGQPYRAATAEQIQESMNQLYERYTLKAEEPPAFSSKEDFIDALDERIDELSKAALMVDQSTIYSIPDWNGYVALDEGTKSALRRIVKNVNETRERWYTGLDQARADVEGFINFGMPYKAPPYNGLLKLEPGKEKVRDQAFWDEYAGFKKGGK